MALTKKELQVFKERLEELRDHCMHHLQGVNTEVKTPDSISSYSQHQADIDGDDFGKNLTVEVGQGQLQQLRQIQRALEKIDEESYGICDITGEPIPKARLEAVPYALTTVAAQEALEKGMQGAF